MRILILFCFISTFSFAQEKREYEERVCKDDFPAEALSLLNSTEADLGKIKYYKEFDGTSESYEAKFKFDGKRYSAEFSTDGSLEDIEVKISKGKLDEALRNSIEEYLENTYERWKIEKIQIQYLQSLPAEILNKALSLEISDKENYELIVATKTKGKLKKYEFLFDGKGKLINQREIVRRSYDFLIF